MEQEEIINILTEAEIIQDIDEEDEEGEDELEDATFNKPPKFTEMEAVKAIRKVELLESGTEECSVYTYIDFLEALLNIAMVYPFPEDKNIEYANIEMKFQWVIDNLKLKFSHYEKEFDEFIKKKDHEMNYQCKMVVASSDLDVDDLSNLEESDEDEMDEF